MYTDRSTRAHTHTHTRSLNQAIQGLKKWKNDCPHKTLKRGKVEKVGRKKKGKVVRKDKGRVRQGDREAEDPQ